MAKYKAGDIVWHSVLGMKPVRCKFVAKHSLFDLATGFVILEDENGQCPFYSYEVFPSRDAAILHNLNYDIKSAEGDIRRLNSRLKSLTARRKKILSKQKTTRSRGQVR